MIIRAMWAGLNEKRESGCGDLTSAACFFGDSWLVLLADEESRGELNLAAKEGDRPSRAESPGSLYQPQAASGSASGARGLSLSLRDAVSSYIMSLALYPDGLIVTLVWLPPPSSLSVPDRIKSSELKAECAVLNSGFK